MEYTITALLFLLGVCVGSFLNVVILRFGFSERAAQRSQCAQCNATLRARDLVPLVSYLALRGRCAHCGSAITAQYPIVEVLLGAVFVLTFMVTQSGTYDPLLFVVTAGFWTAMLGLVVYDVRHTLVPLPFVYALFGFAGVRVLVDLATYYSLVPLMDALWGAVVCGGFFALITAVTRGKGMGIGDAYIAAAIGAMFGLTVGVVAGVFAVWIGALFGISMLLAQWVFEQLASRASHRRVTLKSEIPFAPFLALGALVAWSTGFAPVLFVALGISL
jgi:prepilin signal peptidase PulO-like enzyme (type II secretory pathway)